MRKNLLNTLLFAMILGVQIISAQTSQFTYQGSLKDAGNPANGNYDFQFALFTLQTGGTQAGSTISVNNVAVTNGTFSVNLNFGAQFSGQDLFLEVRVKPTGGGNYTTLTPRQQVNSAPYSVMSQISNNALNLGGVSANQYVLTIDPRLSDSRNPLPGSSNYVQNSTSQQTANFNLNGTGRATVLDAFSEYRLNGSRILDSNGSGLTLGLDTGGLASGSTIVGNDAGRNNTGADNSFFGYSSGRTNTTGVKNSFFGYSSGYSTTNGSNNSFFGYRAGYFNSTGTENVFLGSNSGSGNTTGSQNVLIGAFSGQGQIDGNENTLVGYSASPLIPNGNRITLLGAHTEARWSITNATAIGYRAYVAQSNSIVLGSIAGTNDATSDTQVGIGITAPTNTFTVFGPGTDSGGVSGFNEVVSRFRQITPARHTALSIDARLNQDAILYLSEEGSAKWSIRNDADEDSFEIRYNAGGANSKRFSIDTSGEVAISVLGAAGSTSLCRNASNQISTCSSSLRYKNNINDFTSGLSLIKRLRPVSFNWNGSNQSDMGLVAEEVAEVEPLLVTRNENGEIEGVKYDRVGVVLVNAVQEQQKQIDEQREIIKSQQEQLENQRKEIEALKMIVCSQNPTAAMCQPVRKEN